MKPRSVAILVLLAVLPATGLLAAGCQPARDPGVPVVIDPADLQNFADAFFPKRMKGHHIPGLTFVFVHRGEVVYAQGYGVSDLAEETPVTAGSTVVRIGSISKTFVATAVMQLVEQGSLDLHADVNQYLTALQLEDTFSDPVTLAHLLTHTAGFEDPPYVSNTDPDRVEPLGAHLAKMMPPRTHPPGEVYIYSNYGFALAALIVEEVSGVPFDQYAEEHIFAPLAMTGSTYLVGPPVPQNMATGYRYRSRAQVPQPMDWDSRYPGGSIVSTAQDMGRYMLAHLQDGCHEGACILEPESLALMHANQAPTGFEGQSVTYGFVEAFHGDARMIGHSGAIRGFGSSLCLFPEHDMGYFFSFNEECYETTACQIISEFREQSLKRFFR